MSFGVYRRRWIWSKFVKGGKPPKPPKPGPSRKVRLDTLTLSSSVPSISVTAAELIPLDTLTLTSSAPSLTVDNTAQTIPLNTLTLVSSVISLKVGKVLRGVKGGWPFWRF